jgi:glutamate racemase
LHHIGDTKNAPYGSKDPKEISRLTQDFVGFLANDAKSDQIVIACNTASTIVDNTLEKKFQQLYPNQPITEIIYKSAETVYKQAKVVSDKSGQKQLHIAVLATPAAIASGRYQKALDDIHALNHGKKGVTPGLISTYNSGITNIEELIIWDLNQRIKFGSGLITHDVEKMCQLIGIKK